MGQDLLNPPTVEGWHSGAEWIDSGTLVERVNFASHQMGNVNLPGVRSIINRLASEGSIISPERLVDSCLEMTGCYELPAESRNLLTERIKRGGQLNTGAEEFPLGEGHLFQLIVSSQEYQFV